MPDFGHEEPRRGCTPPNSRSFLFALANQIVTRTSLGDSMCCGREAFQTGLSRTEHHAPTFSAQWIFCLHGRRQQDCRECGSKLSRYSDQKSQETHSQGPLISGIFVVYTLSTRTGVYLLASMYAADLGRGQWTALPSPPAFRKQ